MLNRQARQAGKQDWRNYGAVGVEYAATAHAEWIRNCEEAADSFFIEVRDSEDGQQYGPFVVERRCEWFVRNLRGGK